MSLLSKIEYNHDKIRKLLYDIEALGAGDEELRKPLFNMLAHELSAFIRAEEKTLFKALEKEGGGAPYAVEVLKSENESIMRALKALSVSCAKEWDEKFSAFKTMVFHHIEREERDLSKTVTKVLGSEEKEALEGALVCEKDKAGARSVIADIPDPAGEFSQQVRRAS